jgi:hypothetical protein
LRSYRVSLAGSAGKNEQIGRTSIGTSVAQSYGYNDLSRVDPFEKEKIMRNFLLFVGILCALALSSSSIPSVSSAAGISRHQRAEVNFAQPVHLMGVALQGDYLFVHDDEAMVRGEACTFVYKGLNERANKLVATFHCIPTARNQVAHFTVRSSPNEMGQLELMEFQFAGSTEAHVVPAHQHDAHIAIVAMN